MFNVNNNNSVHYGRVKYSALSALTLYMDSSKKYTHFCHGTMLNSRWSQIIVGRWLIFCNLATMASGLQAPHGEYAV